MSCQLRGSQALHYTVDQPDIEPDSPIKNTPRTLLSIPTRKIYPLNLKLAYQGRLCLKKPKSIQY